MLRRVAIVVSVLVLLAGCADDRPAPTAASSATASSAAPTTAVPTTVAPTTTTVDVYAADRPNQLSPAVAGVPERVYVPNSVSNSIDVIDPTTMQIVDHFDVGAEPQHVVPSYDLKTLYVASDVGNTLTPIDPATGAHGDPIPVEDPYNLYFTPDGRFALVVAERFNRLDFVDPHSFAPVVSVPVPCSGVDHLDFSADGSYLVASCEFSGQLVKVALGETPALVGTLTLDGPSKPQDVKLSPDGRVFYVADSDANGVWLIDGDAFGVTGRLDTGNGAHGLYVSRDSKDLYVSNRLEGSVSVVDLATRTVRARWEIPGGSPDMGGVSADGTTLWLSGRYNSEIYVIDIATGTLRARLPAGEGPHGVCVYPQPGRYSMGHTGVFR